MKGLIIESLHGKIEDLRLFEKVYPLIEQKEIEGRTILAYYLGKGQYEHITNFDNFNGVAYFRLYDDAEISTSSIENASCSNMLNVKYPIRFVCCIRRDQLADDCAFSDDNFAYSIITELAGNSIDIKLAAKAAKVSVNPLRISTDRKKILEQELAGNDLKDINYEFTLISIDLSIEIDIDQKCILTPCEIYG